MGTFIKGISVAVPKNIFANEELKKKFDSERVDKIMEASGVYYRRVVKEKQGPIELIEAAVAKLLETSKEKIEDIDALILITQTPEFSLPATSCILQNKLGMRNETLAFDINLGCSAYPYGIILANSLLASKTVKKILLVVGDITSSTASPNDITTLPLFGDAFSATLLEEKEGEGDILSSDFGTDGSGWNSLIKPVGGYRFPLISHFNSSRTFLKEFENIKYPNYTYMEGDEVFLFSLKRIPKTVENTLKKARLSKEDYDYFIFHQANMFMLKHIINKLQIPQIKVPFSLHDFGNTSGASIPLTICNNLIDKKIKKPIMIIGFGVGFSWASVSLKINKTILNKIIEV